MATQSKIDTLRAHIQAENQHCVGMLYLKLSRNDDPGNLVQRLDDYLQWLDMNININVAPALQRDLVCMLKLVAGVQQNRKTGFGAGQEARAKALYESWELQRWGIPQHTIIATVPTTTRSSTAIRSNPLSPARRNQNAAMQSSSIRIPPDDHPIWGRNGIMYGLALRDGDSHPKRSPGFIAKNSKVFGHNNLQVGAWFPCMFAALIHGAHGMSQAGIAGGARVGAFSVVISSMYDDLDSDTGDIVHYSGSNSHDNEDQSQPPPRSTGTASLVVSMSTTNPVRVLRNSTGRSQFCPSVGIRYDGLYQVMSCRNMTNGKGGLYEQFVLKRCDNQPGLATIVTPTAAQIRDFDRIKDRY